MQEERNDKQFIKEDVSSGLTFRDILAMIRHHLAVIITCLVIGTASGVVFDYLEPEEYKASATMLAMPDVDVSSASTSSYYTFLESITKTITELVTEDAVLIKTKDYLANLSEPVTITKSELEKGVNVTNEALVIKVTYTGNDQKQTSIIANAIVDCTISFANETFEEGGEIVPKYKLLKGNLMKISDAPELASEQSHLARNVAIFFATGLAVSIVYVVIYEALNRRFKNVKEIERMLDLTVLSTIPYYTFEQIDEEKALSDTQRLKIEEMNKKEEGE